MQDIKNTDAFILMQFRAAAETFKRRIEFNKAMDKAARITEISAFVAPFLKRLSDNGWTQRDRMVILVQIYAEV